jgi:hypothetical protein
LLGTITGIDKSVWGGIRKKASKNEENKDKEDINEALKEDKEKNEDKEENPGILSKLKKAIFG